MFQTQTVLATVATEVVTVTSEFIQSAGVEFTIFAICIALTAMYRGLPTPKKSKANKLNKQTGTPQEMSRMRHLTAEKTAMPDYATPESRSGLAAVKKATKRPPSRVPAEPPTMISESMMNMIVSARRREASEAIATYEKLKTTGEHLIPRDFRTSKENATAAYNLMVQSAGRVGRLDLVDIILDEMTAQDVPRPLDFYEGVMKMLASNKWYKEALAVSKRLEADGLEPSPVTLSCLVNFAVEIGESERAIAFFQRLSASSTPSIRAYMTILRVHSKRQDWCKSLATIRDMQEREAPIDSLVLNIVLATGVAAGKLEAAQSLLGEFSDRRVTDVVSFNTVLKGLAQQKHVDKAMQLLEEMCQSGKRPNSITFNTVMDAAVRSLRVTDAWRVLNRMRDSGLVPDKFTCTTLMKGLQNGVTTEQLAVILDLLGNMAADGDASVYSFLFRKVVEAVAQVKNPQLTAKAAEHLRKQRAMLPAHEYRQLLQSLIQDVEPKKCGMSYSLAASHSTRPVAVC